MHGHMNVKFVASSSVYECMCAIIGAACRLRCVYGVVDYNSIIPLWTKTAKKVTKIARVNRGCF